MNLEQPHLSRSALVSRPQVGIESDLEPGNGAHVGPPRAVLDHLHGPDADASAFGDSTRRQALVLHDLFEAYGELPDLLCHRVGAGMTRPTLDAVVRGQPQRQFSGTPQGRTAGWGHKAKPMPRHAALSSDRLRPRWRQEESDVLNLGRKVELMARENDEATGARPARPSHARVATRNEVRP